MRDSKTLGIFSGQDKAQPRGEHRLFLGRVKTGLMMGLFLATVLSSCSGPSYPEWNLTPLTSAIKSKNAEEAKRLIESGVSLNPSREDSFDPLLWSIGYKNDELTRLLIAHGADVNSMGPDGITPLVRAAKVGNPEIVRLLIGAGASVNSPATMAIDPLICAVGNHEIMEMLIKAGADVNTYRSQGGTPLVLAARMSDHASMRLLLDSGADPDRPPTGKRVERPDSCIRPSPDFHPLRSSDVWLPDRDMHSVLAHWLDWTFVKGKNQPWRADIVRLLLDAGAVVKLDSMAVAARTGDLEMLKLLFALTGDANMENQHGGTILHALYLGTVIACWVTNETDDTVRFLIENGANPNRVGALDYFGPCGFPTIETDYAMRFLTADGADPNRLDSPECTEPCDNLEIYHSPHCGGVEICRPLTRRFTPLIRLAQRYSKFMEAPEHYLRHAELLLDMGADPILADPRGTNAMMVAAWYGNVDFIKLLVERGADPTLKDKMGRNALMYAAESRELESDNSLLYLLDIGLDPNEADMNGDTPLIWGARQGDAKALIWLLRHGANPNAANNMGQTALMFSARHMRARSFIMLHEAGADLNATDNDGNTFRHYLIPLCGKLKVRGCSLTTPVRDYVKIHGINMASPNSERSRR